MANWIRLPDPLSNYNVSDEGEVVNNETWKPIRQRFNNRSILIVSLQSYPDLMPTTRSVAKLVAEAFLEFPHFLHDSRLASATPIHLNGNREDCRAENLMWRSRSYAFHYHKQFENPGGTDWLTTQSYVELVETGEMTKNLIDFVIKYGLTQTAIWHGVCNGDGVWPYNYHFRLVD